MLLLESDESLDETDSGHEPLCRNNGSMSNRCSSCPASPSSRECYMINSANLTRCNRGCLHLALVTHCKPLLESRLRMLQCLPMHDNPCHPNHRSNREIPRLRVVRL